MNLNLKKLSIFLFIYLFTFFIFRTNSFAQTAPTSASVKSVAMPRKGVATNGSATYSIPTPTAPPISAGVKTTTTPIPNITPKSTTNSTETETPSPPPKEEKKIFTKMYAVFDTSMGTFKAKLFFAQVPKTVENFVNLAEGRIVWIDPKTHGPHTNVPFYDGLIFHVVRKGFMILTGDPSMTGAGGSGKKIQDEFHPDLNHNKAGVLSMANRGKDTAESQFFITLKPEPTLNKKNAVFGEIVEGFDIVVKIGNVPVTRNNDRPKKNVTINKLTILRE